MVRQRKFTFKPHRSWDAGRYTLRVVGTEKGIPDEPAAKSAIAEFVLEVLDFNDAPVASTLVRTRRLRRTRLRATVLMRSRTRRRMQGRVSQSFVHVRLWAEKDSGTGNDVK